MSSSFTCYCIKPEDIHSILSGKVALRYSGADIEAMKAVASAHQNRNLQEFETALATYTAGSLNASARCDIATHCQLLELNGDPIIRSQLAALYDTLLEQNLVRIIEPFSRVEISHIAEVVKLPTQQVENK